MRHVVRALLVIWFVAALGVVCGCEGGKKIELRYERPAKYQISPGIKRLGIAEFGAQTTQEKQWGQIASDRLAAALDAYNRKYERYELVDRRRLKAILDEQDLQLAISDASSAMQAGKIANVQAMIYGSIKVTTKDESASRIAFDPFRRRPKTIYYTKRYCLVAVNFTLDDVATSKTLAVVSATREYDSEKDKKSGARSVGKAIGFAGDSLPPADKIISHLIDECVAEFLQMISPHEIVVEEKLQKGKSKIVDTGNKLAAAGEYAEALECYQKAIELNAQDHGAVFNAGVMYEAMGNLDNAEAFYDKAIDIKPEEQYIFARKRVRQEVVTE